MNRAALREQIGQVLATTDLFDGTIEDNVSVGRRFVDRAAVLKALRDVDVDDAVQSMPNGIQSAIINGGANLSAAVASKLLVAQGIVGKPRLLLLDDFFQNLDDEYRTRLIRLLTDHANPYTVIAVSHDPEFLAACDLIIVMEGGRIREQGTYAELAPRLARSSVQRSRRAGVLIMAKTPVPVRDVLSDNDHLESAKLLVTPQSHRLFFRIVAGTLVVGVLAMLLPWQQFVEGKGEVTAFSPADRPQVIPTTIGGRIAEWYVQEGQVVKAGDPILRITEVKDDYLDPRTIDRYSEQLTGKSSAVSSKREKARQLGMQIDLLQQNLRLGEQKARTKVAQYEAEVRATVIDSATALTQLQRQQTLLRPGADPVDGSRERTRAIPEHDREASGEAADAAGGADRAEFRCTRLRGEDLEGALRSGGDDG